MQTSVLGTTDVAYKPIALVDQNDLEFLIPADNDTYIDLDIKLTSEVNWYLPRERMWIFRTTRA